MTDEITVISPSKRGLPPAIGRYRVSERIGKGAMGVVYRALDDMMEREVAVKVMTADWQDEPETRARFYREARAAGGLLHRNVITIYDLGDDDGRPYIVMELLRGETLRERLERGEPIDLEDKVDYMIQVCEGLAAAHARGIFHRDVKPGNLFLQADGGLKILDFGVARLADSNMTATGLIVGTPDYMAPEQARGQEFDQRSDVFAAAAVFYYLLSGRKPFTADDLPAVLHRVQYVDPPPIAGEAAPAPLARIVFKALDKAPERRHQQMGELLGDLLRFRRQHEHDTRRIARGAADRYTRLERLLEERRTLANALGFEAPQGPPGSELEELWARYPALKEEGADALVLLPIRRARLTTLAEALDARYDAVATETAALRTANEACEAATAAGSRGDSGAAAKHAAEAVAACPTSPRARALLEAADAAAAEAAAAATARAAQLTADGHAALLAGDVERAVTAARAALAAVPGDADALRLRDTAEAQVRVVRESQQRALGAAHHLRRARDLLDRGDVPRARKEIAAARALDADTGAAELAAEADALAAAAVSVRQRNRVGRRLARAATVPCRAGRMALTRGEPARAVAAAQTALALDPGSAEALDLLDRALRAVRGPGADPEATIDARMLIVGHTSDPNAEDTFVIMAPRLMDRVRAQFAVWAQTARGRWRAASGQTTTEWLMIAGVFTMFGVFMVRYVPAMIRTFAQGLSAGIWSVAP
jgi:serine/threonine-protein kinase